VIDVVPLLRRAELRVARVEEASESGAGSSARFRFQEKLQGKSQTDQNGLSLPSVALYAAVPVRK
jgi:hypothetical protein